MKNYLFMLLAFVVLTGGVSYQAYAEDKKPSTIRIDLLDAETLGKMQKLSAPAEEQNILSALTGKWYYELSFYSKKGADPQVSTGIADNDMVLGGRFLSSKTALLLNIGGELLSYEGWGFLGYDNAKKSFAWSLLDSSRTGMMTGEGKYDEKKKTLEIKGRFNHPLFDKERAYRLEIQFTADDKYKQTVFIADKVGSEFKLIEIEYSRPM